MLHMELDEGMVGEVQTRSLLGSFPLLRIGGSLKATSKNNEFLKMFRRFRSAFR